MGLSAARAEVAAQLRHDAWLVNQLRRRDPTAFQKITSGWPMAHTSFFDTAPQSWSPDEVEHTEGLLKEVEQALIVCARTLPERAGMRLLVELNEREWCLKHEKSITRMRPNRLRKELEGLERSLRWTPSWNLQERLRLRRLITSTKRELARRGLLEVKDPKESG